MSNLALAILGPTASGKSELAQRVARDLSGEIISADSMQVYRGMNIGTAKVGPEERQVPHHMLDILDPGQPFSAQQYQDQARKTYSEICERNHVAIFCGGTGFYIQAALEDMRFPKGEQENNPVRQQYEQFLKEHGSQALWDRLHEVDSNSAHCIHPNNTRRVIRAFEMLAEGISYADQKKNIKTLPEVIPSLRFGLQRDPAHLAHRIDARVDEMIEQGLVDEVASLLNVGLRDAITAPQAIGYKEIVSYLDKEISLSDAIERIKVATRRYAKRQRSWMRRDPSIVMLDADALTIDQMASKIENAYTQNVTME